MDTSPHWEDINDREYLVAQNIADTLASVPAELKYSKPVKNEVKK